MEDFILSSQNEVYIAPIQIGKRTIYEVQNYPSFYTSNNIEYYLHTTMYYKTYMLYAEYDMKKQIWTGRICFKYINYSVHTENMFPDDFKTAYKKYDDDNNNGYINLINKRLSNPNNQVIKNIDDLKNQFKGYINWLLIQENQN